MPASSAGQSVFDSLVNLHDLELYDDVLHLASFVESFSERDAHLLTAQQKHHLHVMQGNAHYNLQNMVCAEHCYYRALQMNKGGHLNVNTGPPLTNTNQIETRQLRNTRQSPSDSHPPCPTPTSPHKQPISKQHSLQPTNDGEVRYRLYLCLFRQNKFKEATGVLEAIPELVRAPKIAAALARLYFQLDHHGAVNENFVNRPAYANLCQIVRQVPLAVHTATRMMITQPGDASVKELAAIIKSSDAWQSAIKTFPWLKLYLKTVHLPLPPHNHHTEALKLCQSVVEQHNPLGSNLIMLRHMAHLMDQCGERERSIELLLRVHALMPHSVEGMDMLATMLFKSDSHDHRRELDNLSTQLLTVDNQSIELYIAMAYSSLPESSDTAQRALYFAQKAVNLIPQAMVKGNRRCAANALLCKARVLMQIQSHEEASIHLREALQYDDQYYDLYDTAVDCKLHLNKRHDANAIGNLCRQRLGTDQPRPLTLHARVLMTEAKMVDTAIRLLEEATVKSPALLEAIYLLIDLYDSKSQYDKAIALLRRESSAHISSKLHKMLGDFLSKTNKPIEAVHVYTTALGTLGDEPMNGCSALDLIIPSILQSKEFGGGSSMNPAAIAISAASSANSLADAMDTAQPSRHYTPAQAGQSSQSRWDSASPSPAPPVTRSTHHQARVTRDVVHEPTNRQRRQISFSGGTPHHRVAGGGQSRATHSLMRNQYMPDGSPMPIFDLSMATTSGGNSSMDTPSALEERGGVDREEDWE